MIGAVQLPRLSRKNDHELFSIIVTDIEKALASKIYTDLAAKVPIEYHQYLNVFSMKEADKLPEHRP
jgi:hypothetical protein